MAEEIKQNSLKLEESQRRGSERVNAFELQLTESRELAIQLQDAAARQSVKAQIFVASLKAYQRNIPDEALGDLVNLGNESTTPEEIGARFPQALERLMAALRSATEPTASASPMPAAPDNESSRFSLTSGCPLHCHETLSPHDFSH